MVDFFFEKSLSKYLFRLKWIPCTSGIGMLEREFGVDYEKMNEQCKKSQKRVCLINCVEHFSF